MPALLPQPTALQPLAIASPLLPPHPSSPAHSLFLHNKDKCDTQYFQHHYHPNSQRDAICHDLRPRKLPFVSTGSLSSSASPSSLAAASAAPASALSFTSSSSSSSSSSSASPISSSPIYNAIVTDRFASSSSFSSTSGYKQHRHISPQHAAAVGAPSAYAHAPRSPCSAQATSPAEEEAQQKYNPQQQQPPLQHQQKGQGPCIMTKKSSKNSLKEGGNRSEQEDTSMGARPRTAASEAAAATSPTKSRFSLLRYRRFREKVASSYNPPPSPSLPSEGVLGGAGFLGVPTLGEDDGGEEEDVMGRRGSFLRRPSTAESTTSTSSSSSRWSSWSKKKSRSSVSLRERWRSSIASSSSAFSSSSSIISASSSSSSSSSSTVSSTWSSLESTPRASIASSRTSISSNEDVIPSPPSEEQKQRPQKRVRAYICRHFVSVPIEEDEEEEQASHQHQHTKARLSCPPSTSADNYITDPIADAFDPASHIPAALIPRPLFAEPTPPPTPPQVSRAPSLELPSSSSSSPQQNAPSSPPPAPDVPTFTLTPASPVRETPPPATFPPTPPITTTGGGGDMAAACYRPKIPQRRSSFSSTQAEKGAPSHCPACVRLQEAVQQMRKVAGIYGPRHSLTVAAAKAARAAKVGVANVAWETSCATVPEDGNDGDEYLGSGSGCGSKKVGRGVEKVVRFRDGADFWGDFCDREGEGGGEEEEEDDDDAEQQQKSREMIITQRLWGPLGERGRKQRDFKRSAAESYVPGRWAPPRVGHEGWLDTSGRSMSYEEFWGGQERHGGGKMQGLLRKWVHVGVGAGAGGGGAAVKKKENEEKMERELLRESRRMSGVGLDVD